MDTKKLAKHAAIVGSVVAIGLAPLSGVALKYLAVIPSMTIWGVVVPHALLAGAVLAAGAAYVEDRWF